MRTPKDYLMLTLKGAGMGAADVIPGVSGGTIAFMTGIFEELVSSINSIDANAVRILLSGRINDFWKHIHGSFLAAVGTGILLSVVTLAKLMLYMLAHHPIETWSFFFGLIVASSIFILRGIKGWNAISVFITIVGILLGITVCTLSPTKTPDEPWFIFISGALAICAMILPGISGSFILLILGKYEYIMGAISGLTTGDLEHNLPIIGLFGAGAVCGIIIFSKILHWLLGHFHKQTLLLMAGFIIGSLVKVWPWSNTEAIKASQFPDITETDALCRVPTEQLDMHYANAILFALTGFFIVTGIEILSKTSRKKH
ncbi:MAG: DUF368 domain-containing protein [Bacteroidaceae bacterium]|nr:DUF368 domain-containing protein [Bacteroidaceae bacterium]